MLFLLVLSKKMHQLIKFFIRFAYLHNAKEKSVRKWTRYKLICLLSLHTDVWSGRHSSAAVWVLASQTKQS